MEEKFGRLDNYIDFVWQSMMHDRKAPKLYSIPMTYSYNDSPSVTMMAFQTDVVATIIDYEWVATWASPLP